MKYCFLNKNKVSIVVGNNSWVIELVETLRKIFINTIMLT